MHLVCSIWNEDILNSKQPLHWSCFRSKLWRILRCRITRDWTISCGFTCFECGYYWMAGQPSVWHVELSVLIESVWFASWDEPTRPTHDASGLLHLKTGHLEFQATSQLKLFSFQVVTNSQVSDNSRLNYLMWIYLLRMWLLLNGWPAVAQLQVAFFKAGCRWLLVHQMVRRTWSSAL